MTFLTWMCQQCGWANDNNGGACRRCGGDEDDRGRIKVKSDPATIAAFDGLRKAIREIADGGRYDKRRSAQPER